MPDDPTNDEFEESVIVKRNNLAAESPTKKIVALRAMLLGFILGIGIGSIGLALFMYARKPLSVTPTVTTADPSQTEQPAEQLSDMSGLIINIVGPADTVRAIATDPNGRTTGLMPGEWEPSQGVHGRIVEEIPNSVNFIDQVVNQSQYIEISRPMSGTYMLDISSISDANYSLYLSGYSTDYASQNRISFDGTTKKGAVARYEISYNSAPGNCISVKETSLNGRGL
jgi:hypothetical protein